MAESKIYSTKQFPTMLVEILEQDRFTALLRTTYSDDPEAKEYILATKLTVTDDVVDWRRARQYDTLEDAKEMRVKYDKSFRIAHYGAILNTTCKDCINASNRDTYYYDLISAYKNIIEEETPEDVETALALYTRSKSWDGRISKSNKAWAEDYLKDKPENNIKSDDFGSDFIHPAIADSFIDVVRNAAEKRQKEQEQTKADDVDLADVMIIVRKNIGDKSDSLKRMKDYALSTAAYIKDYERSLGHIDIFTTTNHTDEIKQAADELGLVCVFKEQPTDRLYRLINEWSASEYDDNGANFSNLDHVNLAYTTDPDTEEGIEVWADLTKLCIVKSYAGNVVSETYYENETDMGDVFLDLSFDEITALTDKEKAKADKPKADFKVIEDEQIEGLTFYMYDDGSGCGVYNSVTIGHVDYATNEYRVGNDAWDVLSTGAPDDDTVDFKEQCRKYVESKFTDIVYKVKDPDKTRK